MPSLPDRLPLVIGVTGHRDLRDQDIVRLEQEVSSILARLRRDYIGGDGETPIVIVSALAEGADRLVARVALREGARLIAPMPMPIDEYRRDFEPGLKAGNDAEFDALMAQAMAAPVMPFTPGNSLEAIREDQEKRNEQYQAVGLFITLHCSTLIALWDGNPDTTAGGTAEVVAFKRHGIPLDVIGSARASLDASEVGPVVHIVTPRMKESCRVREVSVRPWGTEIATADPSGSLGSGLRRLMRHLAHPFGRAMDEPSRVELETWETFEALATLTRQFNLDASRLSSAPEEQKRVTRNLTQLFEAPAAPEAIDSAAARERACERAPRWCSLYAIADTLAQECQVKFKHDWIYLFSCAFIGLVCFEVFSHFYPRSSQGDWLLLCYFIAFAAAFIFFGIAAKGQHQEQFLDYRALAEALRVGVFWKLVGVGSRRPEDLKAGGRISNGDIVNRSVADAYPIRQSSELAWVKVCMRSLELLDTAAAPARQDLEQVDHMLARGLWVHGQYRYFLRQGPHYERTAEVWERASFALFALAPLLALVLAAADFHFFGWGPEDWVEGEARHIAILIMGLLPALAAVAVGYTEKLAFNAQARQYDRMRMLFERGYHMLPVTIDATNAHLAQSLYAELGAEAMKENAEWVAIYRQRPIRPPQG